MPFCDHSRPGCTNNGREKKDKSGCDTPQWIIVPILKCIIYGQFQQIKANSTLPPKPNNPFLWVRPPTLLLVLTLNKTILTTRSVFRGACLRPFSRPCSYPTKFSAWWWDNIWRRLPRFGTPFCAWNVYVHKTINE